MDQIFNKLKESYGKLGEKMGDWLDQIVLYFPNILIAISFSLIAYYFIGIVRKGVYKLTQSFTRNQMVLNLVCNLSIILYSFIALFVVLSIFNLDGTITKILATAGVLGLAVGLALQDPMRNLFSGVYLSVKKLYSIGDLVESNGYFGKISQIDLRNTLLKKLSGEEVIIPNKDVMSAPLINYTISGSRRIEIECGVSYAENLSSVEEVVKNALKEIESIDQNKEIEIFYHEFGGSSINFTARFWVNNPDQKNYLNYKSKGIKAIKQAFDKNKISIPFPIRTLNFGIKGGKTISEVSLENVVEN